MKSKRTTIFLCVVMIAAAFAVGVPMNVSADPPYVWVDDDFDSSTPGWGVDHFDNIQDGVNAVAVSGTVFVHVGTYHEEVTIPKALTLEGEDKETTIIEGSGVPWSYEGIYSNGISDITIENLNIQGFYICIHLEYSSDSTVSGNIVSNGGICLESSGGSTLIGNTLTSSGISLLSSGGCTLTGNTVTGGYGIYLESSGGNTLRGNEMTDNNYNFGVTGDSLPDYIQDIDTSNMVDGKPIYYWVGRSYETVPSDAGYVGIVNSDHITVQDLTLMNNHQGVLFAYTTDSTIQNVDTSGGYGIYLYYSIGSTLTGNTVSGGAYPAGIYVVHSSGGTISGNTVNHGIRLIDSTDVTIEGNTVDYLLHLIESNSNRIIGNTLSGNLGLEGSDDNIIATNTISGRIIIQFSYPGFEESERNLVTGNTILSTGNIGIYLSYGSSDNTISGNHITGPAHGISAYCISGANNVITGNEIIGAAYGISLYNSIGVTLTGNRMEGCGIMISGMISDGLAVWNTHTIDSTNSVNGKPVIYWKDTVGGTVPAGAGEVILVNVQGALVEGQDVSGGTVGILLGFSTGNTIEANTASDGFEGIVLFSSDGNTVIGNTASGNSDSGIRLEYSDGNEVTGNTASGNIRYGIVVVSFSTDNTFNENTVSASLVGIGLQGFCGNTVSGNPLSDNKVGILLGNDYYAIGGPNTIIGNTISGSTYGINSTGIYHGNEIIGNTIESSETGISLIMTEETTISGNQMVGGGIWIRGEVIHWNTHTIDSTNTVNGKPVVYWKDTVGGTVPAGAGEVILANVQGALVEGQDMSGGTVGILLGFSAGNTLHGNDISDSSYNGIDLYRSDSNTILENTMSANPVGILFYHSGGNTASGNILSDNEVGIKLWGDYYAIGGPNTIVGNTISGSTHGIYSSGIEHGNEIIGNTIESSETGISLLWAMETTISGNQMIGGGIWILGELAEWNTHTINAANTVNGKPVIYWKDTVGGTVPTGAGEVILANVQGALVEGQDMSGGTVGILLGFSTGNTLRGNDISDSIYHGISLYDSDSNIIYENTVSYNDIGFYLCKSMDNSMSENMVSYNNYGFYLYYYNMGTTMEGNMVTYNDYGFYLYVSDNSVIKENDVLENTECGFYLYSSNNNEIYHNSIIDNMNQVLKYYSINTWDNGAGKGNYWSDYEGEDLDDDGVGDTELPHQDVDWYPLMDPWGSEDEIEEIIEDIEEMGLPGGIENSLVALLEAAINSIENDNENAAIQQLEAFIHAVESQIGKKLTEDEAAALIAAAQEIIDSLTE